MTKEQVKKQIEQMNKAAEEIKKCPKKRKEFLEKVLKFENNE